MTLTEMFENLGLKDIEEYLRTKQEETVQLDFKTTASPDFNRDDRKLLAKCLSGFANSSGGLIIWGIDAREIDGVDCAQDRKEIVGLRNFVHRLNFLTGDALTPKFSGVRHKAIETADDKGFAVTLVEESDMTPHMAMHGERRYYKRNGHSFYVMEHFDLEDMFGRRQKPHLTVQLVCKWEMLDGHLVERLTFRIENTGRAVAKHAGLIARLSNVTIKGVVGVEDISNHNQNRPTVSFNQRTGVIHPNGIPVHVGHVDFERSNPEEKSVVHLTVYCEDFRTVRAEVNLEVTARPEAMAS